MTKPGPKPLPRAERFWLRVDRGDDCWLWTGSVAKKRGGYGHFYDDGGKLRRAHRVAWEIEHGEPIPSGLFVCHSCDTPLCVRPSHLFLGTPKDNMDDKAAKGRGTPPPQRRGSAHYFSRLTEADVLEIRRLAAAGVGQSQIGEQFGLSQPGVSSIVTRKSWAHVP